MKDDTAKHWAVAVSGFLFGVLIVLLILFLQSCANCWQIPGGCPATPTPLRPCVGTWTTDSLTTCQGT